MLGLLTFLVLLLPVSAPEFRIYGKTNIITIESNSCSYSYTLPNTAGELHYRPLMINTEILEAAPRSLPKQAKSKRIRFGTIGHGLDLPRLAWSQEQQLFSLQDLALHDQLPSRPPKQEGKPLGQQPKNFLKRNPVDVLLIEGSDRDPNGSLIATMLDRVPLEARPRAIAVTNPVTVLLAGKDIRRRKQQRKALERLGYVGIEWLLDAGTQGGAIDQEVVADVYVMGGPTAVLPVCPLPQGLPARPMQNLLLPCGIPKRDWAPHQLVELLEQPEAVGPTLISGYLQERPIFHPHGCMPDSLDCWVETDRGIRRLQSNELSKGKGLPSEWMSKHTQLPRKAVLASTSLHIWVSICDSLSSWFRASDLPTTKTKPLFPTPPPPPGPVGEHPIDPDEHDVGPREEEDMPWEYQLPDLSVGGGWYKQRIRNLRAAIQGRPNSAQLFEEGIEALAIHRNNYSPEGPKYLQILWWEFPKHQQEEARLGSTMRFMVDPGTELVGNPPMTSEQTQVVETFVNELLELGTLRKATRALRRACPLFVVPKAGQPGQWRCIADMKRGGQNDCCSLDPIYLPSSKDILPHLYSGGWSAIADASKYFHNYSTLPSERDLIGIIHPITGEHLWYVGLPMGSVNSPSISCRFGEGILDMLRQEQVVFRGTHRVENTWRTALHVGLYDPTIGHGYVFRQQNGRPIAQIFGFVDDFKVHAATRSDCIIGLNAFMDIMVRLGLICQPVKTSPPAQVQKYCGYIYDTRSTPTLRIPPHKVSRCLSSSRFLLSRTRNAHLSRLSLAVVTGVLQSIVAATPQHCGQTHLRSLYDDLHRVEEVGHLLGGEKYRTLVDLSLASRGALHWWVEHLLHSPGATTCRAYCSNGLIMKWGDGSGTGTGGSTELYALSPKEHDTNPNTELWMGTWQMKAALESSNWKEAMTVLHSLRQERGLGRAKGATIFYITDNLVSYYIINGGSSRSPKLHSIVTEIKDTVAELGCGLEVVHAPGTLMIKQGTDGLSRGLWMAPERRTPGMNQLLFEAVPFTAALGAWAARTVGQPRVHFQHVDFSTNLAANQGAHAATIWTPPPECARQVISAFLFMWTQTPFDTQAIFLIPRILQRQWGRICRHVQEIGIYKAELLPDQCSFTSHLPFVVLYLAPHNSEIRRSRLDQPTFGHRKDWHYHQAEQVRGLS